METLEKEPKTKRKWYDENEVKPPKEKFKFTQDHFNVIGIIATVIAVILWIALS